MIRIASGMGTEPIALSSRSSLRVLCQFQRGAFDPGWEENKMPRAIVTGWPGFIGSNLVDGLLLIGCEEVCYKKQR